MGLEARDLNPTGKNVVLGERFGAWSVFGSYRRDLSVDRDGNPQMTVEGYGKMGLPDRRRKWVNGKLPSLTPCCGLGGPRGHSRNSTGSRETVHSVREFRHTMPPTREAIVSEGEGQGVWGTRVTTLVTPGPLQPQDLAIVNCQGLISSLLTRSGSWGWTLGWWAASTGTVCSPWRKHPPDLPLPTPMPNGPPSETRVLGGCTWGRIYLPTFLGRL